MENIETIKYKEEIIAIIIYNNYKSEGTTFFTPGSFSQQLASISRKRGECIKAHTHNIVKRDIHFTQEALFIKRGKLQVNFYSPEKKYLESKVLQPGDVILLASGGHGFEALEDLEMIEIKQGPYLGDHDKNVFEK